jgi:hypothetical protein
VASNLDTSAGSPGFWLAELNRRLDLKFPRLTALEEYDVGSPPLPRGSRSTAAAFQRFQSQARTNVVGIANSSVSQALNPVGFRTGADADALGDEKAYDIWTGSHMLADAKLLAHSITSLGEGYTLTEPDTGPLGVRINVQSPFDTIVAHAAGDRRKVVAGLRRWREDDGQWMAVVHLPGRVIELSGHQGAVAAGPASWTVLSDEPSGIKRVPIVRYVNRPRLKPVLVFDGRYWTDTLAEAEDNLSIQRRINSGVINRLVVSAAQAFRQRWVTTGENNYTPAQLEEALKSDPGAVWALSGDPKFGEFTASDISQLIREIQSDIESFAALTGTPYQMLPGGATNVGADAIDASRTSLRLKSVDRRVQVSEGNAATLSIAFEFLGDADRAAEGLIETIWPSLDDIPISAKADAAGKLVNILPKTTIMRDILGMTPSAIARAKADAAEDALDRAIADASNPQPSPVQPSGGGGSPSAAPGQPGGPTASTVASAAVPASGNNPPAG